MDVFPPFRIETDRLVLRCYGPADAPLARAAIDSSIDHLRPFMGFAWEAPEPVDVLVERFAGFSRMFETGTDFIYGIFDAAESELIGGSGLHPRVGTGGLEIGYWIRASRVRQGIATETAAALTRVAFEHCGVERVEIRIDPGNVASLAVPPKLGFLPDGTLRRRLPPIGPSTERRDARLYSLFSDEFPSTPCASAAIRLFDAERKPL
ncbi:MAG TPA: GNAT family protein [Gaiellaceae bacterium]